MLDARYELAKRYNQAFRKNQYIDVPFIPDYVTFFNYQSYATKIKKRLSYLIPKIINSLEKKGIVVKPGIRPIHLEPYYREHFAKIRLKNTEEVSKSNIILPLYPSLEKQKQDFVIKNLIALLK
ncbi:MAG: hypothetical protein FJZ11_05120 [Candidatus Omnitrophica bacterium]|nr:hypothetical protein [Candidatus Omnitrophota bacterium]